MSRDEAVTLSECFECGGLKRKLEETGTGYHGGDCADCGGTGAMTEAQVKAWHEKRRAREAKRNG